MYQKLFKPIIDLSFSLFAFVLILPGFLLITIILTIANIGTPFFTQYRPGKSGKIFKIIKFKTMSDKKDEKGNLLPDSQRITRIGSFVRSTSLDEVPQLINVIKGDISLVGPRPLLIEYLPLYNETQKRRHNVKPGITGWAQVNGRNDISWKQKFELDVWYVDNISFKLDLKILFLTLHKVIKRDGVNKKGHITTDGFNGNN